MEEGTDIWESGTAGSSDLQTMTNTLEPSVTTDTLG